MTKPCSKCKSELPLEDFSLSPRHSYGRYPSCKKCQRKATLKWLSNRRNCSRCGVRARRPSGGWCETCHRIQKGKPASPKWKQTAAVNPNLCPRCQERPKLPYHGYCRICKNNSYLQSLAKNKGEPKTKHALQKKTNRHYINYLIKSGKRSRGPCYLCGEPSREFHHFSYGPKSVDGIDTCLGCHLEIERAKRYLLTLSKTGSNCRPSP